MSLKRMNNPLPDAINCSITKEFTQIPNELLRNPEISGKAKSLLCLLLGNKEGWKSCLSGIGKMMKEGVDAINSGINELEKYGYLIRVRYRDKQTKIWKGSFWAYTDIPYSFNIQKNIDWVDSQGLEIYIDEKVKLNLDMENPDMENPDMVNPNMENPGLIILSNKNTKEDIKDIKFSSPEDDDFIQSSHFEKFWRVYPKKVDKGKALSKWNSMCSQKKGSSKRPKWNVIKLAILKQKKSERWQDVQFIPHPTTWLNQCRWLDDPGEMKSYSRDGEETFSQASPQEILESHFDSDWLLGAMKSNYERVYKFVGKDDEAPLAESLCSLYDWIKTNQDPNVLTKVNDNINPSGLIRQYIAWLNDQTWLNNEISSRTFNPKNNLFSKKFLGEKNKELNINVLTGKFIPSYESR
jgi:hypothetical protein